MSTLDERYDIEAEVGRGPSACVFQATEKNSSRTVALKHLDSDDERAKQFPYESEWEKIVTLDHPAIVKAIEHIEEDGDRYVISEFVKGESLEKRISLSGAIPELDCIYIFRSVAQALNKAHETGLLHLNLRPSNLFLCENEGNVIGRIGDFGQWTMGIDPGPSGASMAFFKSPEQRRGSGIMVASDIYALGKLLYVAVSGQNNGRITPTDLPESCVLQEVIYCSIRTRMEDRYQSMGEFIAVLDRLEAEYFGDVDMDTDAPLLAEVVSATDSISGIAAADITVTGQMRADSEVQSMVIACRSHLTNKKLRICRKVVVSTREAIEKYAEFQGDEWGERISQELNEIEDQLVLKEREVEQMVKSAEEAFSEARFEDVQMLATAANEVCRENTGCEMLAEEAHKAITNIRTFLEDAFTSMKVKDYRRADLDFIKILEISPGHVNAIQMRKKIKSTLRRKRLVGFMLKVLPIILLVGGGAGGYFYYQNEYLTTVTAFDQAVEDGRGKDAETAALKLKRRPDLIKQAFGSHAPAADFIKKSTKARDALDAALTAKERASQDPPKDVELQLKQIAATLDQAEKYFDSCKFPQAAQQAEEAENGYDSAFVKAALIRAQKKLEEGKWQDAFDLLEDAVDVKDSAEIRKLMNLIRSKLVPELLIETYVNGRQAKGAYVFINGSREKRGQVTPARVMLDMQKEHQIGVLLPPNEGRYYLPAQKRVIFESKEAQHLRFDLKLILGPEEGKDWTVPEVDMKMKAVSAGNFLMGVDAGEIHERPTHKVAISRFFWIGQYEVTRLQFLKVLGRKTEDGDARTPMGNVTRSNAKLFCQKLTRMESRKNRIPRNYEYRLPTEAEWEYTCRAGQKPAEGVNDYAWHAGNSDGKIKNAGTKTANAWGLYDMLGNVSEWCLDSFNGAIYSDRKLGVTDPLHVSKANFYTLRGGHFKSPASICQPYARGKMAKAATAPYIGFRVILAPIQSELKTK